MKEPAQSKCGSLLFLIAFLCWRSMNRFALLLGILVLTCFFHAGAQQAEVVRACGAVSVALPVSEAAKILRKERNIDLVLGAVGGTIIGLESLGSKNVAMAFSSRALTPIDRAAFPEIQFTEIPIGAQLVVMAVSRDVWEGGVHALNPDQARGIYEGKIKNWKEVGGPDAKISVFMSAPGRGQWEIFAQWLYGEIRRAPVWHGATVKEDSEGRNMVEFTRGSFALLPTGLVDNRNTFALACGDDEQHAFAPTIANVIKKKYPLSRPLLLVVNDKPTGGVKVVVNFMVGEQGQAIVKQIGYVTVAELEAAEKAQ
jgi:phosphate transport system substrate-binding protein